MGLIDADALKKDVLSQAIIGQTSGMIMDRFLDLIDEQPTVNDWIPVKLREATDEEKEDMADFYDCDKEDITAVFDCKLPDDGQEVLITTKYEKVEKTTFNDDCGCYFECYEDEGDVIAWQPLPEPYKEEE